VIIFGYRVRSRLGWVEEKGCDRVKVRLKGGSAISFACAEGDRVWVGLKRRDAIALRLG